MKEIKTIIHNNMTSEEINQLHSLLLKVRLQSNDYRINYTNALAALTDEYNHIIEI